MNKWISVKDSMPPHGESVLIWSGTHDFSGPSIGYFDLGTWSDEREQVGDEGWPRAKHVTHWMPLPKPPEKLKSIRKARKK